MQRVVVEKQGSDWVAALDGTEVARGRVQGGVAEAAYEWARANATESTPVSVQIREEDGTWGLERTYPRSADPSSTG